MDLKNILLLLKGKLDPIVPMIKAFQRLFCLDDKVQNPLSGSQLLFDGFLGSPASHTSLQQHQSAYYPPLILVLTFLPLFELPLTHVDLTILYLPFFLMNPNYSIGLNSQLAFSNPSLSFSILIKVHIPIVLCSYLLECLFS